MPPSFRALGLALAAVFLLPAAGPLPIIAGDLEHSSGCFRTADRTACCHAGPNVYHCH